MPSYSTPGVYFERIDEAAEPLVPVRTDVAAFVGVAERGPVDLATPVESWKQFQATFGNFLGNAYLAYCAKAFFENGGDRMYAVRVAAPAAASHTNPPGGQPPDGSAS